MLIGIGLEMRTVGIQRLAADQAMADRLFDICIEDHLLDSAALEAATPVLAEGRGIDGLVCQAQPGEPAISHVDLDLANQLALTADAEQVADEQHLEQHDRINRRSAIVLTAQVLDLVMDKGKIDVAIDFV